MTVYLLHFDRPLPTARLPVRHYMGYVSERLLFRLQVHAAGNGKAARIMVACKSYGIGWQLARTWPGATRTIERHLKRRKQFPEMCPLCTPNNRQALDLSHLGWRRLRLRRPALRFRIQSDASALAWDLRAAAPP